MAPTLFGINLEKQSKNDILEKIKKYIDRPAGFFHIVSLNAENIVTAQENNKFKKVLNDAQIKIIDGVGIKLAAHLLKVDAGSRIAGVDLMRDLLEVASQGRLKVMLIGGEPKVAEQVIECQKKLFPGVKFYGFEGISNIAKPKRGEEEKIFSIVAELKPHFIFAAFGSPSQELWLNRHKGRFNNIICMGVGGAFDFLSGKVSRAPKFIRQIGFEWLFRLILQPWRISRQLRLVKFIWLVVKEKFT